MKPALSLLLTAILSLPCFGANAVVEGQTKVKSGVQFVLDASSSEGEHFEWIVDEKITSLPDEQRPTPMICNQRFGLSILSAGKYTFYYIASDSEGISIAPHSITVEEWATSPSPPEEPEQPEQPAPAPDYEEVEKASSKGISDLEDPVTSKRLADALSTATEENIKDIIDHILLTRGDEEQKKDWRKKWRIPVNNAIQKIPSPDYSIIIPLLQETLEEGAKQQKVYTSLPTLKVYTRSGCPPCTQWKRVEYPKLADKFNVEFYVSGGTVPRFEVNNFTFTGYVSATTLLQQR